MEFGSSRLKRCVRTKNTGCFDLNYFNDSQCLRLATSSPIPMELLNRGPEDIPRISGTTVPLVGPLALGKGIYVEVAINDPDPAGRFISWKIHLWMITGDYPHDFGNLHIFSIKGSPKRCRNRPSTQPSTPPPLDVPLARGHARVASSGPGCAHGCP